jgi:putative transposase
MKKVLQEIMITHLAAIVNKSFLNKLESISRAILSMRGRITMLGISRWNERYSYKTIERFFSKKIDWLVINWNIIKSSIGTEVILAADECTVSKSGKLTNGVGYFYSGLEGRAIRGIQFLSFSLIDVESRRAYPLFTKQLYKTKKQVSKNTRPNRVGRPKGSKNKNSSEIKLKWLFRIVNWYIKIIKKAIGIPSLQYFVYDGAFGNNVGIQAVKRANLHLISKLKRNSNLFFKFTGEQKKKGRPRIYGEIIDYENIDEKYCKKSEIKGDIQTKIYQFEALHKKISGSLNIVVILSKDLKNNKVSHMILFSTDLMQDYEKIIDYYSLRFQIEFNFRDAKQFFGLEDFMNIKKRRVHNFANLSMYMNNIAYLTHKKSKFENYSVNDLKSVFMAEKYTKEILKYYGEKADDILIDDAIRRVSAFSMIHGHAA